MRNIEFIINGIKLNESQKMTLHVALGNYTMDMSKPFALGEDEHGEFMRKAYLKRLEEITDLYINK